MNAPSSVMKRILAIDDEADVRASLRRFLEDRNFEIMEAENGRVGLELFRTWHPDLVLVDLRMPEVDGLDVLASVRQAAPDTPVIVVSGTGVITDVVQALHLGAWDYVLKPIQDMSILLKAIEHSLERAQLITDNRAYHEKLEGLIAERSAKLQQSEYKYQTLFEHMNVGVFQTTLEGDFIHANTMFIQMAGYDTWEDFKQISAQSLYADLADRDRALHFLKESGSIRDLEVQLVKKDETIYWVSLSAVILQDVGGQNTILGSVLDITGRKLVDMALRDSEQRYRQLVDLSPLPIMMHQDGIFIFANDATAKLFGAETPDELMGTPIIDRVHPDYRELVQNRVGQITREQKQAPIIEEELLRLDGSVVDAEVAATYFEYRDRPAVQIIVRDITERKRADAQIRIALAEKEILLRELYHRTKNNMQVISSMLALQQDYTQEENTKTILDEMRMRIQSLAMVHEKLYQSQNLSSIDLAEYLQELALLLKSTYNINPNVTLRLDLQSIPVLIDVAIPCGLLLNELVSNAFKYAFPEERAGELSVSMTISPDRYITLTVADNGVGFPPGFDPQKNGRLGTEIIYGISTHQLRGEVTFESTQGVTCQIRFAGV